MWVVCRKHRKRDGTVSLYPVIREYCGGRRTETYAGKGWAGVLAGMKFPRRRRPPAKVRVKGDDPRRVYNPSARHVLDQAGYSVYNGRICMNRRRFMDPECVDLRFSMLDRPHRDIIGSPENLLLITETAVSMLKACNRKRVETTFNECFRKSLELMKDSAGDSNGII